ncbi:DUF2510 domain-containing protein [Microbacterium sediminis]|nr:DUF2510 domain-containing protein [Microbacterium sediminis]
MSGTPPAGWYPAAHANNELRYWDGREWHDPAPGVPPVSHFVAYPQGPSASEGVPTRKKGLALAALIVAIVGLLLFWIPWLGLIVAIAGVVLGVLALINKQSIPLTATGTSIGVLALVLAFSVTSYFGSLDQEQAAAGSADESEASSDAAAIATPAPTPESTEKSEFEPTQSAEPEPSKPAEPSQQPMPAEPEQATAAGTVDDPMPQPYVATGLLGGEKYSLTARIINANANAAVMEWNMFNSEAPAGFKYVVVELTMTGIDPEGVEPSIAEWDMELATIEGNGYHSEYVVFGEGMPSMSDGPTLYPGSSFTGYTAYIVPEQANEFLMYDNYNHIAF